MLHEEFVNWKGSGRVLAGLYPILSLGGGNCITPCLGGSGGMTLGILGVQREIDGRLIFFVGCQERERGF